MPLLEASDVKGTYLRDLKASSTNEDAWIAVLISSSLALVARYLGYAPSASGQEASLASTTYTGFRFDTYGGESVRLPFAPITAVASVWDDPDKQFGDSALLGASDYEITPGSFDGIDLLPNGTHGRWSRGKKTGKITCTAGYSTLPAGLKHAVCLLVQHAYILPTRQGKQSDGVQGASFSWRPEDIPVGIQQALAPYMLTIQMSGGVSGE